MPYLLALVLLVSATAAAAEPETLARPARVIDGDSLEFAGQNVRLIGIDTPEGSQICNRGGREWACGDEATAALGELVADVDVRCNVLSHDRWSRGLEVCLLMTWS